MKVETLNDVRRELHRLRDHWDKVAPDTTIGRARMLGRWDGIDAALDLIDKMEDARLRRAEARKRRQTA